LTQKHQGIFLTVKGIFAKAALNFGHLFHQCMDDQILKSIARYITLTPEEASFFTDRLRKRHLRKRQYLVQAGDVNRQESFVTKGCLRAFYADKQGGEFIIQFAVEGWWIADLSSFFHGSPALFHVEALEECELWQIDYASLEEVYQQVPKFERFFRLLIQNGYLSLQQRILSTMSQSAEERYQAFILQYPDIEKRVPLYQIASYLGITPAFLSKIRRQDFKRK
jgi:CRP-like cAMP-binding protein